MDREVDEEERWGMYLRDLEEGWGGLDEEAKAEVLDEVEVLGVKEGEKKQKKRKRDKKKKHKKSKKRCRWAFEPLQEEEYTFSNN